MIVSIQIIDKSSRSHKVLKTLGSSKDKIALADYLQQAKQWITQRTGTILIDFDSNDQRVESFIDAIESLRLKGVDLLLGKIFDEIGFNKINDSIFKQLVLYRLVYPTSKLKTTEFYENGKLLKTPDVIKKTK